MKKFNLSLAKSGVPLCTRDGRDARIICYDRKHPDYPIMALITELDQTETIFSYDVNGFYETYGVDERDLFIKSERKTAQAYVGIFKTPKGHILGASFSRDIEVPEEPSTLITIKSIEFEWEE